MFNHSKPEESSTELTVRHARWPGLIFSLLVPGFGQLRAGLPTRALWWFLGLQISGLLVVLVWISESIPISIGVIALIPLIELHIWMLVDSFRPGRMTWRLWLLFLVLLIVLSITPATPKLIARAFRVPTNSMAPTFFGSNEGTHDHVFVNRLSFLITKPQRGDLVVFSTSSIDAIQKRSEEEMYFVMRVVGLPGERIVITDGAVYANGRRLGKEDGIPPINYMDLSSPPSTARKEGNAFIVGDDEYFVLGDNSPHSYDSRFWGGVPATNIFGKPTKIYYPFSRMGKPEYPATNAAESPVESPAS
jgi:signal peptidase I